MKDYQCCGSKYIEFESGSAFGIRIRILKDPEYGSNTDVYFPSKLIFKRSKVTITIHRSSVLDPGFFFPDPDQPFCPYPDRPKIRIREKNVLKLELKLIKSIIFHTGI